MAAMDGLHTPDLIMEGGSWGLTSFFWIDSARWYNLPTHGDKPFIPRHQIENTKLEIQISVPLMVVA